MSIPVKFKVDSRLGKLTVLSLDNIGKNGQKYWKCQCDCGNIRITSTNELTRKRTSVPSCGCYRPIKMDPLDRFMKFLNITDSCWLWIGSTQAMGYGQFWYKNKQTISHRTSWILHKGNIPEGLIVCHKCDNKKCVNPDHLFLGLHQDNTDDMISKGRNYVQKSKITEDDQKTIKHLYSTGITQREIAKKFKCHQKTIFRIIHKK